MNLDTLFTEALARPEPDREPYLASVCPDEHARQQVLRLLAAHARAGRFLADLSDTPHGFPDTNPQEKGGDGPMPELLGGRYRVTGVLGRGGMGIVYRAEQLDPIRRAVAVKVVRPETASGFVLARFEAERQTLSAMNHPNVATVFDGGTTPDGRPYFVMELVDGSPITQFIANRNLPFADRLALFLKVCNGVAHAHQRGVLHRDLKPSNVLVALAEGRPVVKVIDFGVAKAIDTRPEQAGQTRPGTLIGTPEYMSPEQADLSARDIDTRSDVYSLAVLLYELVTGDTPITRRRVRETPLLEVLQAVRTEDAPPAGARRRGLPPELDWILAKGLHKDRDRRYGSVAALADDLARMTRHEAISAAPTGWGYRAKKFVRRNWLAVGAAVAVAGALLAGTVGTTLGMIRAQDAERVAEGRRMDAERSAAAAAEAEAGEKAAGEKARESAAAAIRERDSATAMLHFFTDDVLSLGTVKQQALSHLPLDPNVRLLTVIDAAAPMIGTRFAGRPDLEMWTQAMIGDYYAKSGQSAKALKHLNRAAELLPRAGGVSDADRLKLHYWLGIGYGACKEYNPAHQHFTQGCRLAEAMASPDPKITCGLELGRIGAALELHPRDDLLTDIDRLIAKATTDLGEKHDLIQEAHITKGVVLVRRKKYPEAVTLYKQVLATAEERRDPIHSYQARSSLARIHAQTGDDKAAEGLLVRVVQDAETMFGRGDRETIRSLTLLGSCRLNLNDVIGALKCLAECRTWHQADKQRQDANYAGLLNDLAFCHTKVGDYANAASCFAEVADVLGRVSPGAGFEAAESRYNAARAYSFVGRVTEAEKLAGQASDQFRRLKREDADVYHAGLELQSSLLCDRREYEAAEKLAAECIERSGRKSPKTEIYYRAKSCLGAALVGRGQFDEAEKHHLEAAKGMAGTRNGAKPTRADVTYLKVVTRVIDLYDAWEKPDEMAKWKEQLPKPAKK